MFLILGWILSEYSLTSPSTRLNFSSILFLKSWQHSKTRDLSMVSMQLILGSRNQSISIQFQDRSSSLSSLLHRFMILSCPRSVKRRLERGRGHSLVGSFDQMMLRSWSRLVISYCSHLSIASSMLKSSFPMASPSRARKDLWECGPSLFDLLCLLEKSSMMASISTLLLVVMELCDMPGTLIVLNMLNQGSVPMEGVRCFFFSCRVLNLALGHMFSLVLKGVELQLLLLVCFI